MEEETLSPSGKHREQPNKHRGVSPSSPNPDFYPQHQKRKSASTGVSSLTDCCQALLFGQRSRYDGLWRYPKALLRLSTDSAFLNA